MSPTQHERIVGSLLAGAIGDALGAPIEFDSIDEIRRRFGPAGLTGYAPAYGRVGAITDDTQMTLFTAEGLLRSRAGGDADRIGAMRGAYLRWLVTQGGGGGGVAEDGWLIGVSALHSRRAPGTTCLSALRAGGLGTTNSPANDSKGCGGVMRVAPVGVLGAARAAAYGCDFAAITHGHPTGWVASGAFALIVAELFDGSSLDAAVGKARAVLAGHERCEETRRALDAACVLAVSGREPAPELIETLGGGWIAEEALAIGVYCALVAADLRNGLLLAVNHSGDSDSTGSICGNLLGALQGVSALPIDLLEDLELADVIERVANDLARAFVDGAPVDTERYPA